MAQFLQYNNYQEMAAWQQFSPVDFLKRYQPRHLDNWRYCQNHGQVLTNYYPSQQIGLCPQCIFEVTKFTLRIESLQDAKMNCSNKIHSILTQLGDIMKSQGKGDIDYANHHQELLKKCKSEREKVLRVVNDHFDYLEKQLYLVEGLNQKKSNISEEYYKINNIMKILDLELKQQGNLIETLNYIYQIDKQKILEYFKSQIKSEETNRYEIATDQIAFQDLTQNIQQYASVRIVGQKDLRRETFLGNSNSTTIKKQNEFVQGKANSRQMDQEANQFSETPKLLRNFTFNDQNRTIKPKRNDPINLSTYLSNKQIRKKREGASISLNNISPQAQQSQLQLQQQSSSKQQSKILSQIKSQTQSYLQQQYNLSHISSSRQLSYISTGNKLNIQLYKIDNLTLFLTQNPTFQKQLDNYYDSDPYIKMLLYRENKTLHIFQVDEKDQAKWLSIEIKEEIFQGCFEFITRQGCILFIGGKDKEGTPSNQIMLVTIKPSQSSYKATIIERKLAVPRYNHSAIQVGSYVYVISGTNGRHQPETSCEIFDGTKVSMNSKEIQPMKMNDCSIPGEFPSLVMFGKNEWILKTLGGKQQSIEIFNIITGQWIKVKMNNQSLNFLVGCGLIHTGIFNQSNNQDEFIVFGGVNSQGQDSDEIYSMILTSDQSNEKKEVIYKEARLNRTDKKLPLKMNFLKIQTVMIDKIMYFKSEPEHSYYSLQNDTTWRRISEY